jgi:uroporphyrinogen-III decarboxylase
LLFYNCGELTPWFIERFASLNPAILSLGSPVKLWEAASAAPKNIVLLGNLPSKKFYSDNEIAPDEVRRMAEELNDRMRAAEHPFIIMATECDVLSVPGCEQRILEKIDSFTRNGA